ncbi:MAG: hypothetical protein ACP5UQ_01720 [Anaerolineae bacterium]
MTTIVPHADDKRVGVLCDLDALYAAIELQLNRLQQVQVIRLHAPATRPPTAEHSSERFDLLIVASVSPVSNPLSILYDAALLHCVGQVPILIVSDRPSRPASDDKIIYLNFPFDLENLAEIAAGIVGQHLASPAQLARLDHPPRLIP